MFTQHRTDLALLQLNAPQWNNLPIVSFYSFLTPHSSEVIDSEVKQEALMCVCAVCVCICMCVFVFMCVSCMQVCMFSLEDSLGHSSSSFTLCESGSLVPSRVYQASWPMSLQGFPGVYLLSHQRYMLPHPALHGASSVLPTEFSLQPPGMLFR